MSERIGVVVTPDRVELPPGSQLDVAVLVTNQGAVVDEFGVQVQGIDPTWVFARVPTLSLFPGSVGTLELQINIPSGPAARAGRYEISFTVTSRSDPRESTAGEMALQIISVGTVGLSLSPQQVTTRTTAEFRIVLSNPGNSEQIVELRVTDPEDALEATLDLDRADIAPAASVEIALSLRPHRRPPMGREQTYQFMVSAYPGDVEVADPIANANGRILYQTPVPFYLALPRKLRLSHFLILAALLAVAAIAIWLLTDPGERTTDLAPEETATALAEAPTDTEAGGAAGAEGGANGLTAEQAAATAEAAAAEAAAGGAGSEGEAGADGEAGAAGSEGGGDAGAAGGGAVSGLPNVLAFELRVPENAPRGEFDLVWEVEGADDIQVDGQSQPPAASLRVQAVEDRQFDLVATNAQGSVTRSVGIVILRPPEIVEFKADPETVAPGQSTVLSWEARRADVASLNQQVVEPERGSREVRPESDTVFTLIVENDLGREERSVLVRVTGQPGL